MPAKNRAPGSVPRNRHALRGHVEAVHAQSFRSVEKFHHVEPSFAAFVARDILLRLAEPRRNGVLSTPLLLSRLDELIDHPAVAVIVNLPCHPPSHQNYVNPVERGCCLTNFIEK